MGLAPSAFATMEEPRVTLRLDDCWAVTEAGNMMMRLMMINRSEVHEAIKGLEESDEMKDLQQ